MAVYGFTSRRAIAGCLYGAIVTGCFYGFSMYSRALKKQFGLSQSQLDNVNTVPYAFGLLSPLAAFGRSPLLALVGTSLVLGTLAFFYFTLTSMQSPEFTPPSVIPDQSVQQMMDEIYGPR